MRDVGVVHLRCLLAAVASCFWLSASVCAAEGRAAAGEALFAQARFDEARQAFEALLASAEAGASDLASAHLHLAALALVAGDETVARRHARAATALDPSASSPEGAPLRLEGLLDEAASAQPEGGLSLAVELPSCPAAGAPVAARALVSGAPEGLVGSVSLRCSSGEASRETEEVGGGGVDLVLDTTATAPGEELRCEALARSASGATLRSRRVAVTLCRASDAGGAGSAAPVGSAPAGSPPSRTWMWVGIGAGAAVLAATAITLGVVLGTAPTEARIGGVELGGP